MKALARILLRFNESKEEKILVELKAFIIGNNKLRFQ